MGFVACSFRVARVSAGRHRWQHETKPPPAVAPSRRCTRRRMKSPKRKKKPSCSPARPCLLGVKAVGAHCGREPCAFLCDVLQRLPTQFNAESKICCRIADSPPEADAHLPQDGQAGRSLFPSQFTAVDQGSWCTRRGLSVGKSTISPKFGMIGPDKGSLHVAS